MAPGAGEPETVIEEALVRPMEFLSKAAIQMIALLTNLLFADPLESQ